MTLGFFGCVGFYDLSRSRPMFFFEVLCSSLD